MSETVVWRVFGGDKDDSKVGLFQDWFMDNIHKLEEAVNEFNAKNGKMTIDYQPKSSSYILEVNTISEEFSNECMEKLKQLDFEKTQLVGVTRNLGGMH